MSTVLIAEAYRQGATRCENADAKGPRLDIVTKPKEKRQMRFKVERENLDVLVSRFFYLLWKACGGPVGMGILQDISRLGPLQPDEEEKHVIQMVLGGGDNGINFGRGLYADYIFGRMMKVGMRFPDGAEGDSATIEVDDGPARPDYQGWSVTYSTAADGLRAAAKEVGVELTE
jgi:hypothetical protein